MDNTIWEGRHWKIDMIFEYTLPGYLILGSKDTELKEFSRMTIEQSEELGKGQFLACSILETVLKPKNILAGRYGLMKGHQIHYHIVPIYDWVFEEYKKEKKYKDAFDSITPESFPVNPDGSALLAYVWRELCVRKNKVFEYNPNEVLRSLKQGSESLTSRWS